MDSNFKIGFEKAASFKPKTIAKAILKRMKKTDPSTKSIPIKGLTKELKDSGRTGQKILISRIQNLAPKNKKPWSKVRSTIEGDMREDAAGIARNKILNRPSGAYYTGVIPKKLH